MITVSAPIAGSVVPMAQVPDPVFAEAIVGPGAAIDPGSATEMTAVAPVAGTIASLKPHAFVVQAADGTGVLVHLGIDTVDLDGEGFTVRAQAGAQVDAGDPLLTWDTTVARSAGKSVLVPVVVLEADADQLQVTDTAEVAAGDVLLTVA